MCIQHPLMTDFFLNVRTNNFYQLQSHICCHNAQIFVSDPLKFKTTKKRSYNQLAYLIICFLWFQKCSFQISLNFELVWIDSLSSPANRANPASSLQTYDHKENIFSACGEKLLHSCNGIFFLAILQMQTVPKNCEKQKLTASRPPHRSIIESGIATETDTFYLIDYLGPLLLIALRPIRNRPC